MIQTEFLFKVNEKRSEIMFKLVSTGTESKTGV